MERISQFRPEHLVSVLGRSDCVPFPSVVGVRHLRLEIDDVFRPCSGFRPATVRNIRQLVDFVKDWKDSEHMLIHCWAGISRSTASAFVLACERSLRRHHKHDHAQQCRRVHYQEGPGRR